MTPGIGTYLMQSKEGMCDMNFFSLTLVGRLILWALRSYVSYQILSIRIGHLPQNRPCNQ